MKAARSRLSVGAMALAAVVFSLATGCGSRPPPAPPAPPPTPLHLEPACGVAPAAGLSWLVEVKPRAIAEIPDLIPAIALVLPEERLATFTSAHGGVDLRQVQDLCVARYSSALLSVARVPIDPQRVADAFEARSTSTVTRTFLAENPRVVRMSAEIGGEAQRLVLFGREAVALEQGAAGPLRAAEAFAFGKLKKASPALSGAALVRASEVLGNAAPVRVFAPGPFEGETAKGLGGLLRAATAVGASARWAGSGSKLAVRVVVTGAWGDDASAAAERLGAAAHVLSESPIGHLFGLHRPVEGPSVHVEPDALVLDAILDGAALARGVHDAVDAEVADIMRR
ncbi:MAG: hypothetical protein KF764_12510 [Labilithrix sp.]|nr:hypothetical protein [Labilithrix sp.]MBX3223772.1 hypothetical protein [Labilithrix sp.]